MHPSNAQHSNSYGIILYQVIVDEVNNNKKLCFLCVLENHGGRNYTLPKGRPKDRSEKPLETAKREIHEELGITPESYNILEGPWFTEQYSYIRHGRVIESKISYRVAKLTHNWSEWINSSELTDAKWFSVTDILDGKFFSETKQLISKARELIVKRDEDAAWL